MNSEYQAAPLSGTRSALRPVIGILEFFLSCGDQITGPYWYDIRICMLKSAAAIEYKIIVRTANRLK